MTRYTVLSLPDAVQADVAGQIALGATVPSDETVKIESIETTPEDAFKLRGDRTKLVAEEMELRLIAPTPTEESAGINDSLTWGLRAIGADETTLSGSGCRVCILDTGVDDQHEAFSSDSNLKITHKDFTGEGLGDGNGHGTHVAGTVFGRPVEGKRIGVAEGVTEALDGKVLRSNGGGSSEMLFNAIQWALQERANIISMSLGFDFPGFVRRLVEVNGLSIDHATSQALVAYRDNIRVLDTLVQFADRMQPFGAGVVFVAASGNESRAPNYTISTSIPAATSGILSVAAAGNSDNGLIVAPFSNRDVDIAAPGVDILSAKLGGGLVALNGTSMACPHVTGAMALKWEEGVKKGGFDLPSYVKAAVINNADDALFSNDFSAHDYGRGMLKV